MKATLEFNIPEESFEHKTALQGMELGLIISELDNKLRNW